MTTRELSKRSDSKPLQHEFIIRVTTPSRVLSHSIEPEIYTEEQEAEEYVSDVENDVEDDDEEDDEVDDIFQNIDPQQRRRLAELLPETENTSSTTQPSADDTLSAIEPVSITREIAPRYNLDDLELNLVRLTGVSAFTLDQTDRTKYGIDKLQPNVYLGLRLDFSAGGNRAETLNPHYMILRKSTPEEPSEKKSAVLEIYRHSMPVFVPLQRLADKYLNANIEVFVRKLREYLVLYNARRRLFEDGLRELDRWSSNRTDTPPALFPPCVLGMRWNPEYTSITLHIVGSQDEDGHGEVQKLSVICSPRTNRMSAAKLDRIVRQNEDVGLLRRIQKGTLTIDRLGSAIDKWFNSGVILQDQ